MNNSHESESHRESKFNTRYHLHQILHIIQKWSRSQSYGLRNVWGRKEMILAELIQLNCNCQEEQLAAVECRRQSSPQPQSTASVTRLINTKSFLQVTPYHGDKTSFLGWKSVAILAQAISCSNVRIIFLRNEFCLVLSCPSVYYPVFYFPTCSQAPRYFVTTRAWIRRF